MEEELSQVYIGNSALQPRWQDCAFPSVTLLQWPVTTVWVLFLRKAWSPPLSPQISSTSCEGLKDAEGASCELMRVEVVEEVAARLIWLETIATRVD